MASAQPKLAAGTGRAGSAASRPVGVALRGSEMEHYFQAKSPAFTLGRWVTPIRYLSIDRAASRPS